MALGLPRIKDNTSDVFHVMVSARSIVLAARKEEQMSKIFNRVKLQGNRRPQVSIWRSADEKNVYIEATSATYIDALEVSRMIIDKLYAQQKTVLLRHFDVPDLGSLVNLKTVHLPFYHRLKVDITSKYFCFTRLLLSVIIGATLLNFYLFLLFTRQRPLTID